MGRRKLVRIILESGPDTKILNQQKESCIDIAGRKNHLDIQETIQNPPPEILKVINAKKSGEPNANGGRGAEVVDAGDLDGLESVQGDKVKVSKSSKGKHKKDKRSTVRNHLKPNLI